LADFPCFLNAIDAYDFGVIRQKIKAPNPWRNGDFMLAGMPGLEPGNAGVKVSILRAHEVFLSTIEYLIKPLFSMVKSALSRQIPQTHGFMRINLQNKFYQTLLANVR